MPAARQPGTAAGTTAATDEAVIGGVLVHTDNVQVADLVEYHVHLDPAAPAELRVTGVIALSSFTAPLAAALTWLQAVRGVGGAVTVRVARCDQWPMMKVEDASAQLAVAFACYALHRRQWYLPLLRRLVVTGVFVPENNASDRGISAELGGLETKVTTAWACREANDRHFRLVVIPPIAAPTFGARVLRAASFADLEEQLLALWSRAALAVLGRSTAVLECLLGRWCVALPLAAATVIVWYLAPAPLCLLPVPLAYLVGALWLRRVVRAECHRLDDEERAAHRHTVGELDRIFVPGDACVPAGWLAMACTLQSLVRPRSARFLCAWAAGVFRRCRGDRTLALTRAPARLWRSSCRQWLPLAAVLAVMSFFAASPLRHALAEIVPGPARIAPLDVAYIGRSGWFPAAARDSAGFLAVSEKGAITILADGKRQAARKLRVSCVAYSGEKDDLLPPGIDAACELRAPACDDGDQNAGSHHVLVCGLPAAGRLTVEYSLPPSIRSRFVLTVELTTHYNGPLAARHERLRWEPQLGRSGILSAAAGVPGTLAAQGERP
jgi:hypothetical protein